jgi:hypothetical protein
VIANNNRNTDLSALLQKLSQLGSPVDLSVAQQEGENGSVEIVQAGAVCSSSIFELSDGRAGYIVSVDIVNRTSRPIYCPEIELRMLWSDPEFVWLPDPHKDHRNIHYYSFPGKGAPEFPRDQVLNHAVLWDSGALQPRVPYEGQLLAVGGVMPKHLRTGEEVEATLVIVASDRTEYSQQILLFADRCAAKRASKKRKGSLYEGRTGQNRTGRFSAVTVGSLTPEPGH